MNGLAPIVFVHGAFSDHRIWDPLIAELGGGAHLLAPDLYGYFPCRHLPEKFSAARHSDDLLALLMTLGRPATLVGHSRGARIALHVAIRAGARVERLVLAEPGGIMETGFIPASAAPPRTDAAIDLALLALEQGRLGDAARHYIDAGHGEGAFVRAPEIVRRTATDNAHTLPGMLVDRTVPLARATARAISCPTVLVHGDRSPPWFAEIAATLASEIHGSETITLPGDHFFPAMPGSGVSALLAEQR